jgi:hypothetical protein
MVFNYYNGTNTINPQDSIVGLNIMLNKNNKNYEIFTQGIFFRENDEMGLIVPKNNEILNFEGDITITISGKDLTQELEFNVPSSVHIGQSKYLMYIPLNDLKVTGNEIMHKNKVYNKNILIGIRYCMRHNFISPNQWNSQYITYSYLGGTSKKPISNNFLVFLDRTDTGDFVVATWNIHMFNGSPVVYMTNDNLGNSRYYIGGIIISDIEALDKTNNNIGIFVECGEIIGLLSDTL